VRLPDSAHTSRPWRIHQLTPDFGLEDVWALPTPGGAEDFPRLVELFASFRPGSTPVRALFAIRWKLGALLGLDRPETGLGARVPTLRDRFPADLRDAPTGPDAGAFTPLYLTADEWALEIANRTVHGVLHLGWVPDGTGEHRGQMAVLVKPNGLLGGAYMTAIAPFRHLLVYPRLLRDLGRAWRQRGSVRQIAVPEAARELSTLRRIDYADAFLLDTSADRTPEQWARTILEDAPAAMRGSLLSGWTSIGLKINASGTDILGWQLRRSTPDHVLLGADSRIGMPGELLCKREERGVLFATFVRQDNPAARAVWAGVEPVHVRIVRRILEHAGRSF
jgi:Protein of unknown function (DUF2867)